jgi:hypothetical protein
LWFALSGGRAIDVSSIVDLCVDFDAIQPTAGPTNPAQIQPELRITPGELVGFFTSAWQAELYIQNRHPETAGGSRTLRTLDLVDLSIFGRTRRTQLGDLSVGVTTPLGLSTEEIGPLVRRALIRMASDFGFTAAESAQI